MYRVLVTGGLGFIASHVVDYFLNNGGYVTLIDNLSSNVLSPEFFKSNSRADVQIGDISDPSILEKIFSRKNYDYIFHLAAMASVPRSVEDEDLNFRSNVIGSYNIIRKAIKHTTPLIFASTAAIYGEYDGKAVHEESAAKPISPYGLSKLMGENLCFYYSRIHAIKVIILRLFNVYGPRQRRYVMSDFLEKIGSAKDKEHMAMLGTGNEIRDFININDVLQAMMLPLKNDNMWGEAYNIGSGKGTRIKQALSVMLKELGLNYSLSFSGKSWQGDVSGICADIRKIKSVGFNPVTDLSTGLKEYIDAERRNGILTTNSLKTS